MLQFFIDHPYMWIVLYFVVMNVIGFAVFGIDKSKAERHKWRIPEKTLFLVAMLGGSIGTNLGMKVFRHKTKHKQFVYGMPAILAFQLLIAAVIFVQIIKN